MLSTRIKSYQCRIFILSCSLFLFRSSADAGFDSSDKTIILLAGQSNMAGRGGVINNIWDQFIPSASYPTPTILRLSPKLQWHEAKEPLHKGIDVNHTCGVGPGMSFANAISNRVPRLGMVGLVPCAVGGTNISQWLRGSRLYSQLIHRSQASLREGGTIQALIWYQGESDTVVKVDAEKYKQRLQKLLSDIRTDLRSPMLPIIQVAIASGEGPYIEEVRQAQMGVDLLNLKTIDAKGLPLEPDNLHLTTPAQVHLGERLAAAFLQFLPTQPVKLIKKIRWSSSDVFFTVGPAGILQNKAAKEEVRSRLHCLTTKCASVDHGVSFKAYTAKCGKYILKLP